MKPSKQQKPDPGKSKRLGFLAGQFKIPDDFDSMANFQQHNPPHVGELIYRTYIEPFNNVSANKIAAALGVAPSTFNRLLNGKADLTPEMAVKLSAVLGGTAESWLRLQESFDLWRARQKVDTKTLHKMNFDELAEAI